MWFPEGLENTPFKFRIFFWNIFFWRFEKHIALSEKKPPLSAHAIKSTFYTMNIKFVNGK